MDIASRPAKSVFHTNHRLAAAQTNHEQSLRQRQITTTDAHIDQPVYQLYNLTPEKIAIMEGP